MKFSIRQRLINFAKPPESEEYLDYMRGVNAQKNDERDWRKAKSQSRSAWCHPSLACSRSKAKKSCAP